MLDKLKGYKTITSAIVVAAVAILQFFGVIDYTLSQTILTLAASLGLYGIYDKVRDVSAK